MSKKLICYSLYKSGRNNFAMYENGALENQKMYKEFYPDFQTRFYLAENLTELGEKLKEMGAEVVYEKLVNDQGGMMWRFRPFIDGDFDVVIFRDCDSRLSERESKLVNIWIESDKNYHIIKNHPHHRHKILGGMWGAKKTDEYLRLAFKAKISKLQYEHNGYCADEMFLQHEIYNHIKNDTLEHNSNIDDSLFIPHPTINNFYVGMPFDANNNPL